MPSQLYAILFMVYHIFRVHPAQHIALGLTRMCIYSAPQAGLRARLTLGRSGQNLALNYALALSQSSTMQNPMIVCRQTHTWMAPSVVPIALEMAKRTLQPATMGHSQFFQLIHALNHALTLSQLPATTWSIRGVRGHNHHFQMASRVMRSATQITRRTLQPATMGHSQLVHLSDVPQYVISILIQLTMQPLGIAGRTVRTVRSKATVAQVYAQETPRQSLQPATVMVCMTCHLQAHALKHAMLTLLIWAMLHMSVASSRLHSRKVQSAMLGVLEMKRITLQHAPVAVGPGINLVRDWCRLD